MEMEERVLEVSSVEEALAEASKAFGVSPEDLEAEVLEESRSFLGILGRRKLKVRVRPRGRLDLLRAKAVLSELFSLMGMELRVSSSVEEEALLVIEGADANFLTSSKGELLKALELLVNLLVPFEIRSSGIKLDADGYRSRRERALRRLAVDQARLALKRGRPVKLEPMVAWERRIVHLALKDFKGVETRSIGEEPRRRVVVTPLRRPAPRRRPFDRGGKEGGPRR